MDQQFQGKEHNIGKFRLSVTSAKPPITLTVGLPENILKLLAIEADKRTRQQQAELAKYYRGIDPELARLNQALAKPDAEIDKLSATQLAAEYRHLEQQLLAKWDAPLVNDFLCMIAFGAAQKAMTCVPKGTNEMFCVETIRDLFGRVVPNAPVAAPWARPSCVATRVVPTRTSRPAHRGGGRLFARRPNMKHLRPR